MTTEWKDLPTLPDVGAAQLEGWDIEVLMLPSIIPVWNEWQEGTWKSNWKFRGRHRQPKMKAITLRKALLRHPTVGCWTSDCDETYAERSTYFIRWIGEPYTVEVPDDN